MCIKSDKKVRIYLYTEPFPVTQTLTQGPTFGLK